MLISGKFQNANAAKVESDDQKATILKLISDPRNLNDKQVVMIYNAVAEQLGWKTITERPVQEMRKNTGWKRLPDAWAPRSSTITARCR